MLVVMDQEQQYFFGGACDALCKSVCIVVDAFIVCWWCVCVGCTNKNTKNFCFEMRLLENIKFTKRHDRKRVPYDSHTICSQFSKKKNATQLLQ